MASPFQQMQQQAMQGLYGMGLTGEMSLNDIRRRQMKMEQFSNQARGIFGSSMFSPQNESMSFSNGTFGSSAYSPAMAGGNPMSSFGSSSTGIPYSSTSNWSSMGSAPRFPYSGMTGGY